jgi:hypothetical protein
MSLDDTFEQENEGLWGLVREYGHLIRQLELDVQAGAHYDWDCPFDLLPYFELMPLLQHLKMHGHGLSFGGDEDSTPVFKYLVQQPSLHPPPEDRALRNPRSCECIAIVLRPGSDYYMKCSYSCFRMMVVPCVWVNWERYSSLPTTEARHT